MKHTGSPGHPGIRQLAVTIVAIAIASTGTVAADPERRVTVPDMQAQIKRVVTARGILDPVYAAMLVAPSPYYSAGFGFQAIKDVKIERVKNDFVPRYAELGEMTEDTIELKFPGGWTATFCTPCSIKFMNFEFATSHVYFSGETFREFQPHIREFLAILRARRLEEAYLIPNPIYEAELAVAARHTPEAEATPVTADPDLERFSTASDAIMIFPDTVHGKIEPYNEFVELLETADYDWFALEMLPSSVQAEADVFVSAPEDSAAYREARATLMESIWPDRFVPGTPPEENRYFKLLELMRAKNKSIIGLEGVPLEYFFFGHGEIDGAGGAARNVLWARHIPESGRGIVFGGSAHFTSVWPVNFQDFLHDRLPGMKILSIVEIEPRPMQE